MTIAPPGFIPLRADFEKLGGDEYAQEWTGREIELVQVDAAARERWQKILEIYAADLKEGRRVVFAMDSDGRLRELPGKLWWVWDPKAGVDASERLADYLTDSDARYFVPITETQTKIESVEGIYLSPFIQMMLKAVKHFEITEQANVKKAELEDYFRRPKLPDGTSISNVQAGYLATFCRSPEAMKGGNKRMG